MAETPKGLVDATPGIASLPVIFYQVNEAVNDPETSFGEIASIVNGDAALCARLLKIVNSSFYGFPSTIETITHAITIIGTAQLRDLMLATTVMTKFKGIRSNLVNMDSFWRHSIACGLAARIIATLRQESNADRFYVMGLLHDVGRLILFMAIPDRMESLLTRCLSGENLLHLLERDMLGFDHSEVGEALLKTWNLPPRLTEAVGNHHNPGDFSKQPVENVIIHTADIIANAMQLGSSGGGAVPPIAPGAWEEIGLPTSKLSDILNQVAAQFTDAIQMFVEES